MENVKNGIQNPNKKLKLEICRPEGCREECKYVKKPGGLVTIQHQPECAKIVDNSSRRKQMKGKTIQCSFCANHFETEEQRDCHVRTKHYQCSLCRDYFRSEWHRDQHVKSVHSAPIPSFKCMFCKHYFSSEEYRDSHIKEKHPALVNAKPLSVKCEFCKQCFISEVYKANHVDLKHPLLTCKICNFSTRSTSDICQHILTSGHSQNPLKVADNVDESVSSHGMVNADVLYQCPQCSKEFTEISELEKHIDAAHNVLQKCAICNLTFAEESLLVAHCQLVHQPEVALRCSACSANNFACRMDLNNHIEKMHPLIKCLFCTLSFRSIKKTQSHAIDVHKRNSYFCSCCFLGFETEPLLNNHIADSHDQSRTEKSMLILCSICSTKFPSRKDLNEHIEQVHPLIRCPTCPRSFRSVEKVESHMKTHQPKNETSTSEVSILIITEEDTNDTTNPSEANFSSDEPAKVEFEDSIEIDEKISVEELPISSTDQKNCRSFETVSRDLSYVTHESIISQVKKEELSDQPKDVDDERTVIDEKQIYSCPICKMTVSNGSLLDSHIETEHAQIANLSSADPAEYPAIAEFL
jgi:hypothetical protein